MATPSMPSFPPGLFESTIGALFLANTLSFLYLGVVLTKAFEYFSRHSKDRLVLKIAAAVTVVGSCVESGVYCAWAYDWAAKNYGNPAIMAKIPGAFTVSLFNVAIATLVNQHFYAWRLYHIGEKAKILPGIISLLSWYQFAFMFWLVPEIVKHPGFAGFNDLAFPASYSWLSATAFADILITGGMIWYLVIKIRRGSPVPSAALGQSIFYSIVIRTVQFNALSLATQTLEFVLFLTHTGFYFTLFTATQTKIFTFSLLISLTSRSSDSDFINTSVGSGVISSANAKGPNSKYTFRSGNPQAKGVHVGSASNIRVEDEEWGMGNKQALGYPVNVLLVSGERNHDRDHNSIDSRKYPQDIELAPF